jgi:hypothetical protein
MLYSKANKNKEADCMTTTKARIVIKALADTAIEKICVMGVDDARGDILKLRDVVHDLVDFWGLDEQLKDDFDGRVGQALGFHDEALA